MSVLETMVKNSKNKDQISNKIQKTNFNKILLQIVKAWGGCFFFDF
jgi:hypothetical protein